MVGEITARLDGPHSLVLENLVEGQHSLTVSGTINPTPRDLEDCTDVFVDGTTHRLEVTRDISNLRPMGSTRARG